MLKFRQYNCLVLLWKYAECVNILCVFPGPSISHQIILQPIWRELSLKGNQVTVITPNPLHDPELRNLTEIDVSFLYEIRDKSKFIKFLTDEEESDFSKMKMLFNFLLYVDQNVIEYDAIQRMINDRNVNFDLVLIQKSFNWVLVGGFAARFRVPVIAISTLSLFLHSHDALGNPTHPVISPDTMLNFSGKLSFFDCVQSLLYNFWYRMFYYWYALPKADRIARKYFGDDMPYLGDLEKNISLLLVNVNPIIHTVRPNVPNIIEINQMHIKKEQPLPEDIKTYLDESPQGVIYFSLGSNVKSANLTERVRGEIISAFSELPYNILWKWELDHLPNQPKNVMTRKWLPQQDILRHPNVKVFLTQGGLQSIEEAITFEVPMVGMPFITDQPSNIRKIEQLGLGVEVDYKTLTKTIMKTAILEVAENMKYKEEVKKSRAILLDQPMKGVEKAVWWIEYVIRHKGAKHLRSPAADMSFFEYFMIDAVAFLLVGSILALYCLVKCISLLLILTKPIKKIKKN